MALTLLQRIVKRFNQVFSRFGEKSTVAIEDFELEHFLLYHGLIGSSPEGQRSFRDVRADLLAAVKGRSSVQMGITLKLMPLFWEDKLKAIVAEIKDSQKDELIACLMPDNRDGMLAPNQNPPFAEDWRVRANAATLIAYVGGPNAVEILTNSLNDTAGSAKSAFCHIVLALAAIKTPAALSAIEPYLFSDEHWFHVDSVNAISHWPFDTVAEILAGGLNSVSNLSDYAAFATARNHKPLTFIKDMRANVQNGGMAMILAFCVPDHKAFQLDQILPFDLAACFDDVIKLTKESGSALRLRAALSLIDWIAANRLNIRVGDREVPDEKVLEETKKSLVTDETKRELSAKFSQHQWRKDRSGSIKDLEGVCLIEMIGAFKDEVQVAKLEELAAQEDSLYADYAVDAIGKIGISSASEKLIEIANRLVNQQERATKAPSAQPVVEENQQGSLTYWHILNALGSLKSDQSFDFLLSAVQDFAPDKRQKALSSLVSVGKSLSLAPDKQTAMRQHLLNAFKDPSTQVRQTAIESAALLGDPSLIEEVAAMTNARETSLWKEANRALTALSQQGHKEKVLTELNKRLQGTNDQARRDRILKLTNELK
jgi:HEAT repeat protein